jgi:hypothetical protein
MITAAFNRNSSPERNPWTQVGDRVKTLRRCGNGELALLFNRDRSRTREQQGLPTSIPPQEGRR